MTTKKPKQKTGLIKKLRQKTGLSQSKFAAHFDMPVNTLQQWERGRSDPPGYVETMVERILKLEGRITLFRDEQHEKDFYRIQKKMCSDDRYHLAVAYLLTLDEVISDHMEDVFDFDENAVKIDTALQHGWQTGTSFRTTRLLMNLWNGCSYDYDDEGEESYSPAFAVDQIFCCEYAPYYWEAIKLRYPEYCK